MYILKETYYCSDPVVLGVFTNYADAKKARDYMCDRINLAVSEQDYEIEYIEVDHLYPDGIFEEDNSEPIHVDDL